MGRAIPEGPKGQIVRTRSKKKKNHQNGPRPSSVQKRNLKATGPSWE